MLTCLTMFDVFGGNVSNNDSTCSRIVFHVTSNLPDAECMLRYFRVDPGPTSYPVCLWERA